MNSNLERSSQQTPARLENYIESFSAKLETISQTSELELLLKKLRFLGSEFDPFDQNPAHEILQTLNSLNLETMTEDPFLMTNIILKMIDLVEQKLQ